MGNNSKLTTILCAVALIGMAIYFTDCGGGNKAVRADLTAVSESRAYDMVGAQASSGGYKIYLDASGSMPGYFTDGLNDYISIVSALQGGNNDSKVYFWGNTNREVEDVNSDITRNNYKAKSSLFQDIFKTMTEDVANEDVLAFIVTDGIVSNSSSVTGQRSGYTKEDLPTLPKKIKASLKNDTVDIAVAVFRFNVPFNGKYWDIDNKPVMLKDVERPLYVFAIGTPGAIVDFKDNALNKKEMADFKKKNPQALYLGMLKEVKGQHLFNDESDSGKGFSEPAEETENYIVVLPNGIDEFDAYTSIPHWIAADGISADQAGKLTVVSDQGVELKDIKAKVTGDKLTVSSEEGTEIDPADYTVTYTITYSPTEAWAAYACDDDRNIKDDTELMQKTFGLEALIKGFELATQHPDTIYEASFKFTKE